MRFGNNEINPDDILMTHIDDTYLVRVYLNGLQEALEKGSALLNRLETSKRVKERRESILNERRIRNRD